MQAQSNTNLYHKIIRAFIENRNSEKEINEDENILAIGANKDSVMVGSYWLDISLINPKLLYNFKYTNVYEIDGYKLIIDESLDKAKDLKKSFTKTKYENFNLAKDIIDYDSKYWLIIFNSKNEIIRLSPQPKSKHIKEFLLKKGIKFNHEFIDPE